MGGNYCGIQKSIAEGVCVNKWGGKGSGDG